ncbi:methyltransferase domain-containing protein [Candidatus Pacearchaeota archaeon]|nr:methyltransferase domain-containing protein [Candidatus Pacearchaeota archaeon]
MPQYIFILGRSPELSIEEIKSYLNRTGNKVLSLERKSHAILVDLKDKINNKTIDFLGGVIAIGEVTSSANEKELDKQGIYLGVKNNITYAVWDFSNEEAYDELVLYLKKRFRQEKLKASQKNLNGSLRLQNGDNVRIVQGLVDEEYFIFNNLFGKINQKSNSEEIEERDMTKPVRRESLSISPRLAKIMINLSEIKEGEVLLDPFCGIGVILQEALLQNIKVIGVDRDSDAIRGAIENLKWGKFRKDSYKLINADSRNERVKDFSVIATEPDLGMVLRKMPPNDVARKVLNDYEALMIDALNNFKRQVKGRIVFTAPLIRTMKGRVSCNISRILKNTGLKVVDGFHIEEYRNDQIVGRNIFVLE